VRHVPGPKQLTTLQIEEPLGDRRSAAFGGGTRPARHTSLASGNSQHVDRAGTPCRCATERA